MFRYLVAHIPSFRLDRCGWSPHQPVILVAEQQNTLRVQAATHAAIKAGIKKGMSVAAARALVPHIETELLDREAEEADLQSLSRQLLRVSPSIMAMPPDTVIAEISRLPEFKAGRERALAERVRIRMNHLGHTTSITIADNPTTALHVARWRTATHIIPTGHDVEALSPLPLAALSIPARDVLHLDTLGVTTIGSFAQLPASSLSGRFSSTTLAAHALACGRASAPSIAPCEENGHLSLTQELPDAVIDLDALIFVLNALVRDLCSRLFARNQAASEIDIHVNLDGGSHQTIRLRLGSPTRNPSTILSQIRHRLERVQLGGPVVNLSLTLPNPSFFDGRQVDLRDPTRRNEAIEAVGSRLQDVLGNRSVLTARTIPRHRPEGAWHPVPFGTPVHCDARSAAVALAVKHSPDPVDSWMGHPEPHIPERPPIMLTPPQTIDVDEGSRTEGFRLSAIHIDGRWHAVDEKHGPEQVAGEWWSAPFQRLYWRVTIDDGRTLWVYRENGQWAVHGWWDR